MTEINVVMNPLCQVFSQELGRQVELVEISHWKKAVFFFVCFLCLCLREK